MTRLRRPASVAAALGAILLLLSGCGGPYTTTPAMTVRAFFLYIRRGAMESAWQELDLPLQMPGQPRAVQAPDGAPGTALRWAGQRAFNRSVKSQLKAFLHATTVRQSVDSLSAQVVVTAPDSTARLYVALHRVDNEWVFERMVVAGA